MTMNEYQLAALRTAQGTNDSITNCAFGLMGECGECVDLIKKHKFQGHKLDCMSLAEELGDLMWYIAVLANEIGFNLSAIALMNKEKLERRYPEGFDAERSVNRE